MSLRGLIKNWPYKLLSLGTAIILVTYVHGELNPQTSVTIEASVLAAHKPEGYIAKLSPEKISIALQGPKTEVETVVDVIKSGQVKPSVDLSGKADGAYSLPVRVDIPQTIAPNVLVQPVIRKISVEIEANITKEMPIELKSKSLPPIGYVIGPARIDPVVASVSGPSSRVNSVSRLVVTADPTIMRPAVDDDVAIKAIDKRGNEVKGVDIDPFTARVAVRLLEAPATKAVFVQPIVTGQPQFPYKVSRITVSPSSVTVKGKPDVLAGATVLTTDEVNVSNATGDVVRYVGLHLPPGVQIEGSSNVRVVVKIISEQNP